MQHTNLSSKNMSFVQICYLAIRPKTLPAAAGPVLLGISLALGDGRFHIWPAIAALAVALLLQIGSNLANDLYDFKKGTDTQERLGPLRVTQAGLLTTKQMMIGVLLVFALAALIGLYLVFIGGWPILTVGLFAIICAIAYTAGPYPLGYKGIADIFVFLFFGPIAVGGTYYLQAGTITSLVWWASIPSGLLVTAILVVNNFRDIETDRKAGKNTLAVRFGARFTQYQFIFLIVLAYLLPAIIWLLDIASYCILLSWLSMPLAYFQIKNILTKKGSILNMTLAGTARLGLIFNILFSIGYILS